eukprot:s3819_g4.t1
MTSEGRSAQMLEPESFMNLLKEGQGADSGETEVFQTGFEPDALQSPVFLESHVNSPLEDVQSVLHSVSVREPEPKLHFEMPLEESTSDVAISKSEYNRALFEARMATVGEAGFKLPWEAGVMGQIFGDSEDPIFPAVVPPVPAEYFNVSCPASSSTDICDGLGDVVTAKQCVQSDLAVPFYSLAVKVLPDRDVHGELEVLWHKALQKWQQLFEVLCFPGPLGTALFQEQLTMDATTDSVVLRDCLGIKSPRTAIKRAQTLLRFVTWMQQQYNDCLQWDRTRILSYLQVSSSSASKGTALLEAFRFAKFVMQLPIPDELMGDPQVRGRAQRMLAAKESYNPARPLKASELAQLERAMESDLDVRDLYMLGAAIFAILSRSRWSDLKHVHQIWVEREWYNGQLFGFVEARTQFHKTATTLVKKKLFMPLVAPLLGVTDVDWSRHWMRVLDELQVDVTAVPFGAVCRAPDHGGGLCRRSITTEEVGAFLNRFLSTPKDSQISSHSLKHTTLSWCSAYGMDEPSRTLLGHHELQGSKALSVYSRDMLTRPLQLYCEMLSNIRCDHFRPDESRTSRMVDLMKIAAAGPVTATGVHDAETCHAEPMSARVPAQTVERDDDCVPTTPLYAGEVPSGEHVRTDDESSEIQSTDSSSSADSSSEEDRPETKPDISGPIWRNRRSSVVHKCSSVDRQTACGRLVDDAHFELMNEGCSSLLARCIRCFRGEVISNIDGLVDALDGARAKRFKKL